MSLFDTLCTPAKLYLILLVPVFISMFYNKTTVWNVVALLIWAPIWTYVLNWFCSKGYSVISWFFVIIPLVSILVMTIIYAGSLVTKQ
jgi:hypothetical protein